MAPNMNRHAGNVGYTSFKRLQSLELMNPPSNSPLRKTSFVAGTFNLVATIVGGGVLSLPLAFAKVGVVVATGMMVLSAIITDFSLYLLCCCARRTGSTAYMDIVRFAFGPIAEFCTTAVLWIFLSGVLVAFNVLLKGIFAPLARDFVSTYTSIDLNTEGNFDAFVLLVILLLVLPLTLKRNLYALRHICYVGFTSVCVIAVSIGVRAYQRSTSNHSEQLDLSSTSPTGLVGNDVRIKYFTTDWTDALFAFPIIVLSFLCSYNMVEVHCALEDPTRKRVKSAIHTAIASCFVLFQVFGLAGYFYAYDACRGNIFLNFDPSDSLIIAGRLGMGLTLMFGTPVVTLPCREAFLSLMPQLRRLWNESGEQAELVKQSEDDTTMLMDSSTNTYSSFTSCDSEFENETCFDVERVQHCSITPSPDQEVVDDSNIVHVGTTMGITAYAFFGAVSVPGVAIVWSILGSSLGMIIGFIIPCACYLKIRGRKGMWRRTNVGALALLIFSIVMSVVCTTQTMLGVLK